MTLSGKKRHIRGAEISRHNMVSSAGAKRIGSYLYSGAVIFNMLFVDLLCRNISGVLQKRRPSMPVLENSSASFLAQRL